MTEDADFAAALQNGHEEGVDDAEGGDREREARKEPEEHIEDNKDLTQSLAGIQQEKALKPNFLMASSIGERLWEILRGW